MARAMVARSPARTPRARAERSVLIGARREDIICSTEEPLRRSGYLLRRLAAVPEAPVELVQEFLGGFRNYGAGREDRLGAGALELGVILGWHHATHHDHDVV